MLRTITWYINHKKILRTKGSYSNSFSHSGFLDQDGAEPCPNSVSAGNLVRLSNALQRPEWTDRAAQILKLFYERLTKIPIAVPEMVCALMMVKSPFKQASTAYCKTLFIRKDILFY